MELFSGSKSTQQRYFRKKKSWESSWQLYDQMKRESKSDVVMLVPADFLDGVSLRLCWHDKRRSIDETVFATGFYQKFNISEKFSASSNVLHFTMITTASEMWSFYFSEIWYDHWPVQSVNIDEVEYLKEWFWKRNILRYILLHRNYIIVIIVI